MTDEMIDLSNEPTAKPSQSNASNDEPFELIEHQEKTNLPWNQRNPDLMYDYLISLVILGIGVAFIIRDGVDNWFTFVAEILFGAGLIPLVELFVEFMRGQRGLEINQDLPVFAFIIVSIFIYIYEKDDSIYEVAGETFFATGFIYWIHRAMAFAPHPNDTIRELEEEISDLKHSVALGLADGYWWNFVEPIARKIQEARDQGNAVSLTFSGGARMTEVPYFLILVPKAVVDDQSIIPTLLGKCRMDDNYVNCHMTDDKRPRPMTFYHINVPNNNDAIFDIPTTLNVITKQMKQMEAVKAKEDATGLKAKSIRRCVKKKSEDTFQDPHEKEIRFFTKRLAYHMRASDLEDVVRVVEVDIQNEEKLEGLIDSISGAFALPSIQNQPANPGEP